MARKAKLAGKVFGELTVIEESEERINNEVTWKCLCSCKNETLATTKDLTQKRKKSCGCLRRKSPPNVVNLKGQVFGMLTVIKRDGHLKSTQEAKWLCECECGNKVSVLGSSLRDKRTRSCGCLKPANIQIKDVNEHVKDNLTIEGVNVPSLKRKTTPGASGVKGVFLRNRKGKVSYEAYITLKGKRQHLGTFTNIRDATLARKKAEKELHDPYIKKLEERQNENK